MKTDNPEIQLAFRYIEETGCNVFLTGKAGTGKTTFLKRLRQSSCKRMIVVAPTGIAAINAGGMTIHSFFQLPFAPFVPGSSLRKDQKGRLFRFGKEKINILRSLDLLVIDEISMVRADLLDHIDVVLRRYRDHEQPFGGIQLLLIGDMQQLAPVVKEEEKLMLSDYYDTLFFFGSRALSKTSYITIELKTVYRQSDSAFLNLLNKIRTNRVDKETFDLLNSRYIPHFNPREKEGFITLTTHNRQAQEINHRKLLELPATEYRYPAKIDGDFPEHLYPAEQILALKEGAQIMFIKNDTETPRRFYNGKLGKIYRLGPQTVQVKCNDWKEPVLLERMRWDNTQYSLNPDTKEIEEKITGSFEHYPIKTAWAITIHKSQGLTFDKVIINAGASFAHGQVYVALSRCRTLEGLVLSTPLNGQALVEDQTISQFCNYVETIRHEAHEIEQNSQAYTYRLLCELFDFGPLQNTLHRLERILDEHLYRSYPKLLEAFKKASSGFSEEVLKVAERFRSQYTLLFKDSLENAGPSHDILQERILAAAPYFLEKTGLLKPLFLAAEAIETDNKLLRKRWDEALMEFTSQWTRKMKVLEYAKTGFSLPGYLKARAESVLPDEIRKESRRKEKMEGKKEKENRKLEVSSDMLHPELFEKLKKWRNRKAAEIKLPVYTVIQQKAMQGIANLLPSSKEELIRIPYFGKKSTEKYGAEILEIVVEYRREKGLSLM